MSQTDDSQMSWPEYARTYGDEALRQYVDEPEEVRLQLLTDPELAELYGRAGSQAEPAAPSESEAASPWWARGEPGLAPPPLGDTQMDPILYAREHGDQALVD